MKLIIYLILSGIIYLVFMKEGNSYAKNIQEKCRNCGMIINSDLLYCPYCKEKIKKECDCCGKLIDVDWRYCPFCENNELSTELIKIMGGKK